MSRSDTSEIICDICETSMVFDSHIANATLERRGWIVRSGGLVHECPNCVLTQRRGNGA